MSFYEAESFILWGQAALGFSFISSTPKCTLALSVYKHFSAILACPTQERSITQFDNYILR